jgi:ATP-dependent helicase Lhr and Lhr-like helicase
VKKLPSPEEPPEPAAAAEAWFASRGWAPFEFQREVWRAYLAGESGLIHAATGTGKTYAAWLGPLLEALAEGRASTPPPLRVLWITPLRALAADTEAALRAPLDDLGRVDAGEPHRRHLRRNARPAAARLPTALVTTPRA